MKNSKMAVNLQWNYRQRQSQSSLFSSRTLCFVLLIVLSSLITMGNCAISDCRIDKDCARAENEGDCCARVIVEDPSGNKIDSHYCLQKSIIENLGNRYYYKGILARAYCDAASIIINGVTTVLFIVGCIMYQTL